MSKNIKSCYMVYADDYVICLASLSLLATIRHMSKRVAVTGSSDKQKSGSVKLYTVEG